MVYAIIGQSVTGRTTESLGEIVYEQTHYYGPGYEPLVWSDPGSEKYQH